MLSHSFFDFKKIYNESENTILETPIFLDKSRVGGALEFGNSVE